MEKGAGDVVAEQHAYASRCNEADHARELQSTVELRYDINLVMVLKLVLWKNAVHVGHSGTRHWPNS